MGRSPFPDTQSGPVTTMTAVAFATVVIVSFVYRILDSVVLASRPPILAASLRIFLRGWLRTPYREADFGRLHAARQAGLSLTELIYGETPVVTARALLARAGVGPGSHLVDLGAGRGRVLLAAKSLGAEARGIDVVKEHVEVVGDVLAPLGVAYDVGPAEQSDLDGGTHFFLTATCLSAATRARLTRKLEAQGPGVVVISVTHPLDGDAWELLHEGRYWFTWGRADVFVQRRREAYCPSETASAVAAAP